MLYLCFVIPDRITRRFRLPIELSPELRSNIVHYYFDISWWGLYAGATAAFLTIYAARLGATPAQIGLLTALPAGISLVISLPLGDLVRRMGAHRATFLGAFLSRLLFLLYALLPFFFFSASAQVQAILAIAILITIPGTMVNIAFNQLLIEAVPSDWRGTVVSVRNAFFSIISFVVTVVSGQILAHSAFPGGYQLVFFIGFIGGLMTAYHIYHIRPLPELAGDAQRPPSPAANNLSSRLFSGGRFIPVIDGQGRRYIRIISLLFFFNMTNNMVAPLVPEVLVHSLKLSDAWISIGTAANSLIVFGVSIFIARLTRRIGNRRGVTLGAALVALQAVLLALATDPPQYLLSVLAGGIGSGVLLSMQYNYHLENVPGRDRALWLSWNLLLGNGALLLGSLSGPFLAHWTGVPLALGIFGGLRLLMGLVIFRLG